MLLCEVGTTSFSRDPLLPTEQENISHLLCIYQTLNHISIRSQYTPIRSQYTSVRAHPSAMTTLYGWNSFITV